MQAPIEGTQHRRGAHGLNGVLGIVAVVAAMLSITAPNASAAPLRTPDRPFAIRGVGAPRVPGVPRGDSLYLSGVAVRSATDGWAVGAFSHRFRSNTRIMHWDGRTWSRVPSPDPGRQNSLDAVAADSATDAWAVGTSDFGGGIERTLTVHWDGISWQMVPSPSPGDEFNALSGIAALSPTDAWAVGSWQRETGGFGGTILHWDGTSWTRVHGGRTGDALVRVSADSPTDAWAVGYTVDQTLILHWNGTAWHRSPAQNPGAEPTLLGVDARTATDVWAVGYKGNFHGPLATLVEHWNGSRWSIVRSPDGGHHAVLASVSADGSGDAWAVGSYTPRPHGNEHTLTLHFTSGAWRLVESPSPPVLASLSAVSALSPRMALAVGSVLKGSSFTEKSLIERWNGERWRLD